MRWGGERESPKASSTHNPEAATGRAARARVGKVWGGLGCAGGAAYMARNSTVRENPEETTT